MKNKPGFVFDANVLVSAALFHQGKPAQAVDAALDAGVILVSDDIVRALNDVLSREKFERYTREEDRARFFRACCLLRSLRAPDTRTVTPSKRSRI